MNPYPLPTRVSSPVNHMKTGASEWGERMERVEVWEEEPELERREEAEIEKKGDSFYHSLLHLILQVFAPEELQEE